MTLRNAFGDLALEATLAAVHTAVTGPTPSGGNIIGATAPATTVKAAQGILHLSSTGRVSLSLAGNVRFVFRVPTAQPKTAKIIRLTGMCTLASWATVWVNPTTGVPATPGRPELNALVGGGTAPVGTLHVDIDATVPLSGGTDTGLVIEIPPNERWAIDLPPLHIGPGTVLGFNIPITGPADTAVSFNWFEE